MPKTLYLSLLLLLLYCYHHYDDDGGLVVVAVMMMMMMMFQMRGSLKTLSKIKREAEPWLQSRRIKRGGAGNK